MTLSLVEEMSSLAFGFNLPAVRVLDGPSPITASARAPKYRNAVIPKPNPQRKWVRTTGSLAASSRDD